MKSNPFEGSYLFHLHTRLTDGELSVTDYFDFARNHAIKNLIFLEHIRRNPSYDVAQLVLDIKEHAASYDIGGTIGFEAKLLPDGSLDIDDDYLTFASVIGIAEHCFPPDIDLLRTVFTCAIERYRSLASSICLVWVHPGLLFRKLGMAADHPIYTEMLNFATDAGVLIERNLKYQLLPLSASHLVPADRIVLGVDAHTASDMVRWQAVQPHSVPCADVIV